MNLKNLFEMQKELDARIVKEKGLEGQDLLPKKILALQVELGELANEWRGFKFWSKDQEARTWYPNVNDICEECKGNPIFYENNKIVGQCEECDGCGVHFHNPLLEEYVDCLHFILSIGLEIGYEDNPTLAIVPDNTLDQLNDLFQIVAYMYNLYNDLGYECGVHDFYDDLLVNFFNLGKLLGLKWEQIEQAYMDKNKVNHERQSNGY